MNPLDALIGKKWQKAVTSRKIYYNKSINNLIFCLFYGLTFNLNLNVWTKNSLVQVIPANQVSPSTGRSNSELCDVHNF